MRPVRSIRGEGVSCEGGASARWIAGLFFMTTLAACGGGAGETTAVSSAATPLTTETTSSNPASSSEASTPVQTGGTATDGARVSRVAVIKALHATTKQLLVPAGQVHTLGMEWDSAFSSVSAQLENGELVHRSSLTLPTDPISVSFDEYRPLSVVIGVSTDGVSWLRFDGRAVYNTAIDVKEAHELVSDPFDLPDPVPLDRMLHQFSPRFSGDESMRFFVGTIPARPDWMRVCWRYELAGILRVSCTRHAKRDGQLVGADSVNDLGSEYRPPSNEQETSLVNLESTLVDGVEPQLMRCNHVDLNPGESTIPRHQFALIDFDTTKADGGLFGNTTASNGFTFRPAVMVLGDGRVEYVLGFGRNGSSVRRALVDGHRIVSLRRDDDTPISSHFQLSCD